MKFHSRKDILFQLMTWGGTILFILYITLRSFSNGKYEFIWTDILMLLAVILLHWVYFGTQYELTTTELRYRCGPLKANIEIERIHEIIRGKTLWSGTKPATARKGLIIKYDKHNEIYISPDSNETFIREIKALKPEIKITENTY